MTKYLALTLILISNCIYPSGFGEFVGEFFLRALLDPSVGKNDDFTSTKELLADKNENAHVSLTHFDNELTNCERIQKLKKESQSSLGIAQFNCKPNYSLLFKQATTLNANVIYIESFENFCDIGTYKAYAYSCNSLASKINN